MKKLGIVFIGLFVSLTLVVPSAMAGSKQRHRWEGVAIGVGASVLGGALLGIPPVVAPSHGRVSVHVNTDRPRYKHARPRYGKVDRHSRYDRYEGRRGHGSSCRTNCCGHWEVRKVWVPPVYERVWNPGHFNRRNEWVAGKWIRIEQDPGYYRTERVWVSSR